MIRLVDVGARGGVDRRWQPFHNMLDVIGFEPDPSEAERLNNQQHPYRVKFIPVALGSENDQQATLHICREPGCSSLLKPNPEIAARYPWGDQLEITGEEQVTLTRMDSVLDGYQPHVIKVDTQGTELDILEGAGKLLDEVIAVELEVEFIPIYQGQPLFTDVDLFMRDRGFQLRGLRRICWRTRGAHTHPFGGQLVHGDALYLRPDRLDTSEGKVVLAAYQQYDLLAAMGAAHLIPKRSLGSRIGSKVVSRFSDSQLRRLVDRLGRPDADGWHDPDFF